MLREGIFNPFFSIIVPAYNNEKEIRKCIDSILIQSFRNFELILVDDGSTDSTPLICDQYAEIDKRVKVIHKVNKGAAAARNEGLFRATGKYVYYVDADDWIAERLLQEAAQVLACPNAPDIFIFGHEMLAGEGGSSSYPCYVKPGLYKKQDLISDIYPRMMYPRGKKVWLSVVSGYLWDKIISIDLLKNHYCRDTALFMVEDAVCAYECVYFAEQIFFSPHVMYYYNCLSESSMHRKYHEDLLDNFRYVVEYYHTYLGGKGDAAIERQIDWIEYNGLYYCVWQELQFGSSICQSARHIKKKIRQRKNFPICSMVGLSFAEKCFVLLMSFRFLYLILSLMKISIWAISLWRKMASVVRSRIKRANHIYRG